MIKALTVAAICLIGHLAHADEQTPTYLYKVLSVEDWEASQGHDSLHLASADYAFIHFSKEDQLDRILSKYWSETPFVILKVATDRLPGKLVFEANPGGASKYYHLYNGSIPLTSIVESKPTPQTPKQ